MTTRSVKPADTPWLSPYLAVSDVDASVSFYAKAFGFVRENVVEGSDGKPMHAEMRWHDARVMFGPESASNPSRTPKNLGGHSLALYLYTENVDALYERAVGAGAVSAMPPQDMFWGDRMCSLLDPDGHMWTFATNVGDPGEVDFPGHS